MKNVSLSNVSRSFGLFTAVSGFTLDIEQGEFVTLLGSSGCGKTTTLRMVAGLETNDGGSISIGDSVVSDAASGVFVAPEQRGIGMVFQSYAIWPHMTVFENVAYPLQVRRKGSEDIRRSVLEALRLVEMEKFAERPAPALSGGQQQRVAIARALVANPSLLLLDEPLSNLDARLRKQMGDELRQLQQKTGVTALYVTHDQDEAMALSDRVVVMQGGKVLQVGAPEQIYRCPESRDVATFFGDPNLFEAVVVESRTDEEGRTVLRVRSAAWEGEAMAAAPLMPDSKVSIMIRAEDLRVGRPERSSDIRFDAAVVDSTFRGATRSIVADAHGGRVQVETPSIVPVAPGDTLSLTAPTAAVWAIPA